MTRIRLVNLSLSLAAVVGLGGLSPSPALGEDTSYGYFRTLEGSATQIQAGTETRTPVEVHQPILVGDRIWVSRGSRVEMVLPDRNRIRLDGRSELVFDQLAYSADADDRETVVRLLQGNLQVTVVEAALGEALPRIDTPNATILVQEPGRYRITADGPDWSQVVVRNGFAEVLTRRGAAVLQPGEEALVEGGELPRTVVRAATVEDSLERWAVHLEELAEAAEVRYVDSTLRYEAAPLARYGSWVQVERSWAWRPAVSVAWQPYWRGRWVYTPSGLTWVSYEPWGRLTYHYGSWDFAPGYGWIWFPGAVYSPAWVYWYWGPSYVGWCPVGYYSRFYHSRFARAGSGFRFGVYGWAGGSWSHYDRWLFVPSGRIGDRNVPAHARRGNDMRERLDRGVLHRGVLTTDTRPVKPQLWGRPQEAMEALVREPVARGEVASSRELPDMTDFVARRPDLPQPVARRMLTPVEDRGRPASSAVGVTRPGPAAPPEAGTRPRPMGSQGSGAERREPPRRVEAAQAPTAGDWRERRHPTLEARPSRPQRVLPPTVRGRVEAGGQREGASESSVSGSPREAPPVRRVIDGARSSGASAPSARPARPQPRVESAGPQGRAVAAPRAAPRRIDPPSSGPRGVSRRSAPARAPAAQPAPERRSGSASSSRGGSSSREGRAPKRRSSSGSGGG